MARTSRSAARGGLRALQSGDLAALPTLHGRRKLALAFQEKTARGRKSNFNKLISRDHAMLQESLKK